MVRKAERDGRAEVTLGKLKWLLEFAYPFIGDRKVGEIKAAELLAVLCSVEKRDHHETARRLRSTCGQEFRYAPRAIQNWRLFHGREVAHRLRPATWSGRCPCDGSQWASVINRIFDSYTVSFRI